MNTQVAIRTTVVLEFVTAPIIRCVARKDMSEYGLTEGSVFYLAYSSLESKAQGANVYHILRWNYSEIRFNCPCRATVICKHMKAVNASCKLPHSLQGYKPESKSSTFAALMAKYDYRVQAGHEAAELVKQQIAETSAKVASANTPSIAEVQAEEIMEALNFFETVEPVQEDKPIKYCDVCGIPSDEYRIQDHEVICEKCIRKLERNATKAARGSLHSKSFNLLG